MEIKLGIETIAPLTAGNISQRHMVPNVIVRIYHLSMIIVWTSHPVAFASYSERNAYLKEIKQALMVSEIYVNALFFINFWLYNRAVWRVFKNN